MFLQSQGETVVEDQTTVTSKQENEAYIKPKKDVAATKSANKTALQKPEKAVKPTASRPKNRVAKSARHSSGERRKPAKAPSAKRPSLPTPNTKPIPASQLPTDQVKPFSAISDAFPTIVRSADNDAWIELRCYICGTNTKKSGEPLRGGHGFVLHLKAKHPEFHPAGEEKWHQSHVLKTCCYHRLSAEEAQGILDRTPGAYLVPMVKPSGTEQKAIATVEGHDNDDDDDNDDDFIDDDENNSDLEDDLPLRLAHSARYEDNDEDDDVVVIKPRYMRQPLTHSTQASTPSEKVYLGARKSAPSLPPKRSLEKDEAELDSRKAAKTAATPPRDEPNGGLTVDGSLNGIA